MKQLITKFLNWVSPPVLKGQGEIKHSAAQTETDGPAAQAGPGPDVLAALSQLPSQNVRDCLDPDSQTYVGVIPSMPAGVKGHLAALDVFFDLVGRLEPAVFCDIGANQGEGGRRALASCPKAKVFGFEANPKIHALYAQINRDAGVNWHNYAVADHTGSLDLFVPTVLERGLLGDELIQFRLVEPVDTGKSSLLKRDENAQYDVVKIPSITLDGFLQDHAPDGRVALWIDVEGAGDVVLRGAKETLARTDILIIEVEGFSFWKDQALVAHILDVLQENGFVPVLRDREYQDAQFNIICLRDGPDVIDIKRDIGKKVENHSLTAPQTLLHDQDISPASVPIVVPCFNNPTYAQNLLCQLRDLGFSDIRFVDNASDSPAMLTWLDNAPDDGVHIERLNENLGPQKSVFSAARLAVLPRWFCVTDPDLQFNPALPDNFLEHMAAAAVKYQTGKAGFALDISDRRSLRQERFDIDGSAFHIWDWETQFWNHRQDFTSGGDPVFKAAVDTTFALYDLERFRFEGFLNALRIGGRFTATHLPWLARETMSEAEARHYRASQKFSYYAR